MALWEGNPPLIGGLPSQRPVTGSFDVFFDLRLNKWLNKQLKRRWFEKNAININHTRTLVLAVPKEAIVFSLKIWRHPKETFSTILVLWEGNPPLIGGLPSQRPVTGSFDVFFDLRLNKWLNKQLKRRWFETPSRSWWRHYDDSSIIQFNLICQLRPLRQLLTPKFYRSYLNPKIHLITISKSLEDSVTSMKSSIINSSPATECNTR